MELIYSNDKTEEQCTSMKAAKKLMGGSDILAKSLMARINALKQAETRKDLWRIILEPLDENKEPYNPCNIDEIAQYVRIVEITEVSKHYG